MKYIDLDIKNIIKNADAIQFYLEYEDSYIDANTHGVIKLLVEEMQEEGLLPEEEIDWDNLG